MKDACMQENQRFIRFCKEAMKNPELLAKIVKNTGIYTKSGRLSAHYNHKAT